MSTRAALRGRPGAWAACALALFGLGPGAISAAGADGSSSEGSGSELSGHVALLLRDLSLNGSAAKYSEDSDGLGSGLRLGELLLDWRGEDAGAIDRLRLSASGLGGDPEQEIRLDLSRRGRYELRLRHSSRRFLYDLFELSSDEDGHAWSTRSERSSVELAWQAAPWAELQLGWERRTREGDRVFMKDLSRDVFLLDAPVDDRADAYWVGAELELGKLRVEVRQTLEQRDRRFRNTTEADPGLNTSNLTFLTDYRWLEVDESRASLTTLRAWAPLGERVVVNVGYHGTLFGAERFDSRARQDATGIDFSGAPLLISNGTSAADVDRDRDLFDASLSVRPSSQVVLRFGWRSLKLKEVGVLVQDLSATGTSSSRPTELRHETDSLSAVVDYRPLKRLGLRLGYLQSDRSLRREGQGGEREEDFRSSGDSSWLAGLSWRPTDWLRVNADRERSELDAAFAPLSALERSRTGLRLTFTPREGLELGLAWREDESENPAASSRSEASVHSLRLSHRPSERVSWSLGWSRSEILRLADTVFDGAAFGGPSATFPGGTVFDVSQQHVSGQARFAFPRGWSASLRVDLVDVNGDEQAVGSDPNVPPAVPSKLAIDQDWIDGELGFERELPSGAFVGAGLRWQSYDEADDRLGYDARIFELRFGHRF